MNQHTHTFEEIVLDVGTLNNPLKIAFVTGEVDVTYSRVYGDDGKGYEIDDYAAIRIQGPCVGDPEINVQSGTDLWDYLCRSLEAYHDKIMLEIAEDDQPDPDRDHDRRQDAA